MNSILRADFSKKFSGSPVIRADTLEISSAGVTVLFGSSGSGKTTILRCLAGLETPDTGEIFFGGETWFRKRESGKRKAKKILSCRRKNVASVLCRRITRCFRT